MTPDDLAAIRARANAATEGPWAWASHTTVDGDEWAVFDPADHALASNRDGWAPDAEFIAHARSDVPALLAEVERLTSERDEARESAEQRFLEAVKVTNNAMAAMTERDEMAEEAHRLMEAANVNEQRALHAEAERDALAAMLARVEAALEEPHEVAVHAGGGNLVTRTKVIYPADLRAALADPKGET